MFSAGIPSCETAIEIAPRKMNQNATAPISFDGLKSGAASVDVVAD